MRATSQTIICLCIIMHQEMEMISAIPMSLELEDVPKFLKEPPSVIYYSERDIRLLERLSMVEFPITVSPANATITVMISHQNEVASHHMYIPVLLHSREGIKNGLDKLQTYVMLQMASQSHAQGQEQEFFSPPGLDHWIVHVHNLQVDVTMYILLTTEIGSVRSRPVTPQLINLSLFPRYADEHLSVLIGNTGRVVCHLPHAKPSPPSVKFHHNGKILNMLTEANRYRLIYIGGDGTGLPWEQRRNVGSVREPLFLEMRPSAAVLLIHPLQYSDSGEYICEAHIGDKRVLSEQKTYLNVAKPKERVKPRLRFSSGEIELSYMYDKFHVTSQTDENEEVWSVRVGTNLTLFCLFEGAPIVSTHWYFDVSNKAITHDEKFGILSIDSVQPTHEGTYTCSSQSQGVGLVGRLFTIKVEALKALVPQPSVKVTAEPGKDLVLGCASNSMRQQPDPQVHAHSKPTHLPTAAAQHGTKTNLEWLHNGRPLSSVKTSGKLRITSTDLLIRSFSKLDEGIYQCWAVDKAGNWVTASILVRQTLDQFEGKDPVGRSNPGVQAIQERTEEGLTGHLNCNLSSAHAVVPGGNTRLSTTERRVVWFRGFQPDEPLDLKSSNEKAGRIKYVTSQVNHDSQILSIVNPRQLEDAGPYMCKIYDSNSQGLLGQLQFELVVESSKAIEVIRKMKMPENKQAKIYVPKEIRVYADELDRHVDEKIMDGKMNDSNVLRIQVSRLAVFTTYVSIMLDLLKKSLEPYITQYTLQYRHRVQRDAAIQIGHRSILNNISFENTITSSANWSSSVELNVSIESNQICLRNEDYLNPGEIYSFRVIGHSQPQSKAPTFTIPANFHSPWSEDISFRHLLKLRPMVQKVVSTTSTSLDVYWIYPSGHQFASTHIADWFNIHRMKHTILYQDVNMHASQSSISWVSCPERDVSFTYDVDTIELIREDINLSAEQNFHITLNNLLRNTTYAVAVYGSFSEAKNSPFEWHTLLSHTVFQKTNQADSSIPSLLVGTKTNVKSTDVAKRKTLFAAPGSVPNGTPSDRHESHILVVVLGSLAGVLLVITLVLIALCLWCQFNRKHRILETSLVSPKTTGFTVPKNEMSYLQNGSPVCNAPVTCLNFSSPSPCLLDTHCVQNVNPAIGAYPAWSTLGFQKGLTRMEYYPPWSSQTGCSVMSMNYLAHEVLPCDPVNSGKLNGLLSPVQRRLSAYVSTDRYLHNTFWGCKPIEVASLQADRKVYNGQDPVKLAEFERDNETPFSNVEQSSSVYSHVGSQSTNEEHPLTVMDEISSTCQPFTIQQTKCNDEQAKCHTDYCIEKRLLFPVPLYLTSSVVSRAVFNPTFVDTDPSVDDVTVNNTKEMVPTQQTNLCLEYGEVDVSREYKIYRENGKEKWCIATDSVNECKSFASLGRASLSSKLPTTETLDSKHSTQFCLDSPTFTKSFGTEKFDDNNLTNASVNQQHYSRVNSTPYNSDYTCKIVSPEKLKMESVFTDSGVDLQICPSDIKFSDYYLGMDHAFLSEAKCANGGKTFILQTYPTLSAHLSSNSHHSSPASKLNGQSVDFGGIRYFNATPSSGDLPQPRKVDADHLLKTVKRLSFDSSSRCLDKQTR